MGQANPGDDRRAAGRTRGAVRAIFITAGALALLLLLVIGGALATYYAAPQTKVASGAPARIRIEQGATTRQIASELARLGVVRNANGFALRCRVSGADGKLRPGVYDLKTGMSDAQVVAALEAGSQVDFVAVTIPEGFRVDQIADRLEKQAGVSRTEFLALAEHGAPSFAEKYPFVAGAYKGSLEGYLFPKTYMVEKSGPAGQVIDMMLGQFGKETAGLDFAKAQRRGVTPAQVVTIASMIERESRLDSERPLISSVIYNRIDRGIRLKIDATIQYVLRTNRFRLTNADLYTKSPYNTYLHAGLPPGPISNPGLKSLKAAAEPADTRFLYYVLTGKDGSHTFTTSLVDFLAAKRKSKEVFGR
jgi:UPF0755 protein